MDRPGPRHLEKHRHRHSQATPPEPAPPDQAASPKIRHGSVLVQSKGFSGLPLLFERPADTLRCYLRHGKVMTVATILKALQIDCDRLHAETRELREAAKRAKARCQDLCSYLATNFGALADYGHRHRNGLAVSSSRAEGCVDDIGNTRMGKRRRMRWSPRGTHRVAVTRAAVLDGRPGVSRRDA